MIEVIEPGTTILLSGGDVEGYIYEVNIGSQREIIYRVKYWSGGDLKEGYFTPGMIEPAEHPKVGIGFLGTPRANGAN